MLILFCAIAFILPPSLSVQLPADETKNGSRLSLISHNQAELGVIVLEDFSFTKGKIIFTTDTGGCTDKTSFKVNVKKEKGISEKTPNFTLSIERIKIDECKAFFPEGVVIEFDIEKDFGLKGDFTVSVTNLIYPNAKSSF